MDQPNSASEASSADIKLTPDMRPLGDTPKPSAPKKPEVNTAQAIQPEPAKGSPWPAVMGLLGLVMGAAALGLAGWSYSEGQRETLRLSTELAQLRVSLDLYARNSGSADLSALQERLAALESVERTAAVPPAIGADPSAASPASSTATNEDCLPSGMRLLVAAGDNYPICDQAAAVSVSFVDNGYITLGDGTSVASGGTTPLPGNPACTLAVTSSGDEGLTGYAEIRVSC